jgi:ethanolamine utilization microcompartment shell protein EutS
MGLATGSPIWEEMNWVAGQAGAIFLLNITPNRRKEIAGALHLKTHKLCLTWWLDKRSDKICALFGDRGSITGYLKKRMPRSG